jgi:hypothetical protein
MIMIEVSNLLGKITNPITIMVIMVRVVGMMAGYF